MFNRNNSKNFYDVQQEDQAAVVIGLVYRKQQSSLGCDSTVQMDRIEFDASYPTFP